MPEVKRIGVEPNKVAYEHLRDIAHYAYNFSMRDCRNLIADLTMTRGLLIHIPPLDLPEAYEILYESSRRYILIAEYFNPRPVEIEYRGEMGRLWKRDFAGELLDRFPRLKLKDYGFVYSRDPHYPQDNINWFLFDKEPSHAATQRKEPEGDQHQHPQAS